MDSNAYRVLQVDAGAVPAVIQAAYRALARIYHPDGSMPDVGRMSAINRAYAVLRDPAARRRLDARLALDGREPIAIVPGGGSVAAARPQGDPRDPNRALDFGRYSGWTVKDLARHDPDYLRWLSRHSSGIRFRDAIAAALPNEPDLRRRASSVA